ncbi:MAG: FAD-dependent oxidoreductase [Lachnospiraceae bacterium]|nr:FAD-dependent oxidoreductase [Lachnospiraceae bacterium]
MESLWRKQAGKTIGKMNLAERKCGPDHWDVIVIGAGMAGLLTAFYLKEKGKAVLVLEANEIASGQTEKTTAKITSQHGLKYSSLIKKVGRKKAQIYARANEAAILEYEKLIRKNNIECQFKKGNAYLYTRQDAAVLQKEAEVAKSLGLDAFFTKETELPFEITGAVGFRNQAQFSPLEFVRQISEKLEVWEHTKVISVHGNSVLAQQMGGGHLPAGMEAKTQVVLHADKIVIAAHYPFLNVPGFYFLRQHQERSYVLALSGCEKINGMYYGIDTDGLSLRQSGDCLLLGGGSHRTGKNGCGGAYDMLMQAADRYFPDNRIEARWSAQDCMPHDGIPFIGKYSVFTPNLYVATGFLKWGMTSSMVAAMILSDELCGEENEWTELFSPQRLYLRAGISNMLTDIGESIKGLFRGFFYRPRCPHLGCELVWNPDDKSWDCPCHGSRFDADGNLLDNPAKHGCA